MCIRDRYEGVRDYARREGLRMTAHVAESEEETLFVHDGSGIFASRHQARSIPVVARGCLPLTYLDHLGLLGPDMLLVHAIEAEPAEIVRLRETGTFVAHCPKSNAFLGHRIARVADMRAHRVHVALGTDSVASNDAIDMFAEMRLAREEQRMSFEDVFGMATIEGGEVCKDAQHIKSQIVRPG